MNMIRFRLTLLFCTVSTLLVAQKNQVYKVSSPDNKIHVTVQAGARLTWSVNLDSLKVIAPSPLSIRLSGEETLGRDVSVRGAKTILVNSSFKANLYKKATVADHYNQLTLDFKGDYGIIVKVYNDGAAYRFFTKRKTDLTVLSEEASFIFEKDYKTYLPYVRDLRVRGDQFISSFEALYDETPLSKVYNDSLAFLPLLVELDGGVKAALLDVGLENYPGMLVKKGNGFSLKGEFARYPVKEIPGGYNKFNSVVSERADYIAKVSGVNSFPWRAVVISKSDKDLANNDMAQKLASPSRITDISWIKPGKVSWDWWNNWNLSHVDFRAGINNQTYKYYIDFASANSLEYIIMDEGWSDPVDLLKVNPAISVKELVEYADKKNVGIILWASWRALMANMDALEAYSKLGVKGFKIDFLDRDDQVMTASTYAIAKKAAEHKLLIDLHGVYKPDGLQRTYPNVVNYEGVKGLENSKWTRADDVPRYDVTIPFIRMLAGPMDYTPGAMRNVIRSNFVPSNSAPMSQGTRSHQLAMYVVFEAPLQMLADSPTEYMKEQESTTFISKIPTVFDETVALDGKVAEYIAMARRKGDTWYVGAMTNWRPRELQIDFSFLAAGNYEAEIFKDGVNADRDARDYKREVIRVSNKDKITVSLSNGGGWACRLTKL